MPVYESNRKICKYLDRITTVREIFTPEECTQIINTGINEWIEEESKIQKDADEINQNFVNDFDYRNTTLFTPPEPDEWLFSKIFKAIMEVNNNETGYQFHVEGFAEPPTLMRYQAANINKHGKPGQYDWHMDVGPGETPSTRKISYTIILNPDEYEGGELCFHIDRTLDKPYPGQDNIGSMIMFPSYLVHKVTPVTRGTRYAIVGWAHGNSFV
jgi:PKHD-type hydroxylase